ncbi:DUF1269 domain-containing protein [Saccharothrix sp. Mg75]|uniref:DUF1269 domain-containing protein n=1 Tax=Saccharothrix sp. Mg75 TaxID=3445357 RepID=UPI003EEDAE48
MATLTIWKFHSADGADRASRTLESLAKGRLITVHDAAVVSWPENRKKPKLRQLHNLVGRGALSGAFWGMLVGLLFLAPLAGAAIGAAAGAAGGGLADIGIDDDLVHEIRERVTPGTSALFVLTTDAVLDKVKDAFADSDQPELLFTNLSPEQEQALREVFTDD